MSVTGVQEVCDEEVPAPHNCIPQNQEICIERTISLASIPELDIMAATTAASTTVFPENP
jgi:hypothetical protein